MPIIPVHQQNTDTKIAEGTANETTAASIRGHLDSTTLHLPDQTGNVDKFLKTNGTAASWATPPSGSGATELSKTFTYDIDGRLSLVEDIDGTKTFTYDIDGRLSQITGTGVYANKLFTYALDGTLSEITVS